MADDQGAGSERASIPLYISLSIGAAFLLTLGVIGIVTFRNVQSAAPAGIAAAAVAAPAAARPAAPAAAPAARGPAPVRHALRPRAQGRPSRVAVRHDSRPAKPPVTALLAKPAVAQPAFAQRGRPAAVAVSKAAALPAARRVAETTAGQRSDVPAAPGGSSAGTGQAAPATMASAAPVPGPAVSAAPVAPAAPAAAPAAPAPAPVVVAAAPAPQAPVYAPERIVEARLRNAVQPDFPSDLSVQGQRGTSVVRVTIGPHGEILRLAIDRSSGRAAFDRAAMAAARSSEYVAPQIDGRPGTASYRMVYEFSQ
jgi:TonB family protein